MLYGFCNLNYQINSALYIVPLRNLIFTVMDLRTLQDCLPQEKAGRSAGAALMRCSFCLLLRASCAFLSQVVILTLLYSWAGLGIAIVNDFKSVEGDRELGLQSLPVAFGVEKAKWICVASIDATQLGIAAWLYSIGEPIYAAVLTAFVLPQIFAQWKYFLPDPVENDVK